MVNLWERLNHIYPHKFAAACGISAANDDGSLTDVAQTWASGLAGVTGEMLANGLRACVASSDGWPPSLPDFRSLCLPEKRDPIHRDYVALPRPPHNPGVVDDALTSMRAALSGKR